MLNIQNLNILFAHIKLPILCLAEDSSADKTFANILDYEIRLFLLPINITPSISKDKRIASKEV
jgi:hypothetical protein